VGSFLMRLASLSLAKAAILSVVLGGVYYMSGMFDDGSLLKDQIVKRDAEIKEQEVKALESDAALREVERVRTAVGALSDQFKTVSQALPSEIQMSDIIRVVDMVARASGVSIKSKEPRPVRNKDFYEEIPLKITLEGSFSEITLFLYYLASTERIMKANNFTIAMPTVTDRQQQSGRLIFDGQVVSYRFLGMQAAAANGKEQKR
jgi:type IV pilus assembly protein PilO